jgi:ATP-dependent exoDNAse (exonuclease V) beta subunit
MTDWLMQGFYAQEIHNLSTTSPQAAIPWNIRVWQDIQGLTVDNAVDKNGITAYLQQVLSDPAEEIPDGWGDAAPAVTSAPLKTSVSAMTKKAVFADPMPLSGSEEDADTKRVQEEILQPLRMSELPSRPAFLEQKQMTGAERGSLTHKALSIMPLEDLRGSQDLLGDVRRILHDLADKEVFTYQELMLLHMQGIAGFYRSALGQRLLSSARVRREWAFNLVLDDAQETLLQGVIDCAFLEDGQWVLVDYKTDRISDEQAFCDRYRMQLTWYARALQRITGVPVREMWLYAISIGKAFQLEASE